MATEPGSPNYRAYLGLTAGLLAIAGASALLWHSLQRHREVAYRGDTALPAASVVKAPPNPSDLSFSPPTGSVLKTIGATDAYYHTATARWLHHRYPGLAPDGSISLNTLRLATGGVPLPTSLASIHVTVPASMPANNSVAVAATLPSTSGHITPPSPAEQRALWTTVGQAALAYDSNNPLAYLDYLDGTAPLDGRMLARAAVNPSGRFIQHIAGKASGLIPNGHHFYRTWAVVTPTAAGWQTPETIAGQSLLNQVTLDNPVQVDALATMQAGTSLDQISTDPFRSMTLGLVASPSGNHWFILHYTVNAAPWRIHHVLDNALQNQ